MLLSLGCGRIYFVLKKHRNSTAFFASLFNKETFLFEFILTTKSGCYKKSICNIKYTVSRWQILRIQLVPDLDRQLFITMDIYARDNTFRNILLYAKMLQLQNHHFVYHLKSEENIFKLCCTILFHEYKRKK